MENQKKSSKWKVVLITGVLFFILLFAFNRGTNAVAEVQMDEIENKVAEDAVKQYEIAKQNGSAMDAYTQASIVCAAYLQAQDQENYKKWKEIEKKEAKAAGMPEM